MQHADDVVDRDGADQPLLLVYHGMNGNEDNYYGQTVECLKRLKCDSEFGRASCRERVSIDV